MMEREALSTCRHLCGYICRTPRTYHKGRRVTVVWRLFGRSYFISDVDVLYGGLLMSPSTRVETRVVRLELIEIHGTCMITADHE